MKLPNGEQAIIDVEKKLLGYCLNMEHARGRHKARVFAATLGFSADDPAPLVKALRQAARSGEARFRKSNDYGDEYVLEFTMDGPHGPFIVTSAWFVDNGIAAPRLTNCYVNLDKSKGRKP